LKISWLFSFDFAYDLAAGNKSRGVMVDHVHAPMDERWLALSCSLKSRGCRTDEIRIIAKRIAAPGYKIGCVPALFRAYRKLRISISLQTVRPAPQLF
jgi:hypothetical protein